MKNKRKSPLLLLFVSVISICSLVFVCLIVNQLYMQLQRPTTTNTNTPETTTAQTNGGVVDTISDNPVEVPKPVSQDTYVTAVIKQDKTIALYDIKGLEIVINLDQRNWSNIRWSPNKKFVSVLANSDPKKPDIKDMYLYDVLKQSWKKTTTYQSALVGVVNPEWLSNNTILFTQGTGADNWLHSFNIESEEITKLKRYDGVIDTIFKSVNQIRFTQKGQKLIILDNKAEIVWNLNEPITDADGSVISIDKFFYLPESKKAYFTTNQLVPILLKIAYQDSLAFSSGILSYNTICIFDNETILAQDQNKANIILNAITTNKLTTLYTLQEGEILLEDNSYCSQLGALLPIQAADGKIIWTLVKDSKLSKISYLDNAIEVIQ